MSRSYYATRVLTVLCILQVFGLMRENRVACRPWSAVFEVCEPIRIVVAAKNLVKTNYRLAHLAHMFDSVLKFASHPLHWLILIPTNEVQVVNDLLERVKLSKARVPVTIEYVDLRNITGNFEEHIDRSRRFFLNTNPLNSSRYHDEVFHIGMIYHRVFPFRRLISLDMDLRFNVDISLLADQFKLMSKENIMGLGYDLTPHYWYDFRFYRARNPGTAVGAVKPGYQGFNAGVILFDLQRMRQSELYNSYFDDDRIRALCNKYNFNGTLAYQDFFTLLGMEKPELFYPLDCSWNRQLDISGFADEKFTNVFEDFHRCNGKIRIHHANGGSTIPDEGDD